MNARTRLSGPLLLAAFWVACSNTVAGDKNVEDESGDGDASGGESSGGDGDGDGDGSGAMGGQASGDGSGGSAASSGGAPGSGGAPSSGGTPGTGGTPGSGGASVTVDCGSTSYDVPAQGAYGCMDFDGDWPPAAPWAFDDGGDAVELKQDRLTSAPNSLQLSLPFDAATDAGLTWTNVTGDDLEEVRLEFEFHQNTLSAAPQGWNSSLKIACVDFGREEACLGYQWGANPRFTIQLRNYMTVETLSSCGLSSAPVSGSWDHIVLTMNNQGEVSVKIEDNAVETCQGPGSLTGTVATAWIGQRGPRDDWSGFWPHFDDVYVTTTREP